MKNSFPLVASLLVLSFSPAIASVNPQGSFSCRATLSPSQSLTSDDGLKHDVKMIEVVSKMTMDETQNVSVAGATERDGSMDLASREVTSDESETCEIAEQADGTVVHTGRLQSVISLEGENGFYMNFIDAKPDASCESTPGAAITVAGQSVELQIRHGDPVVTTLTCK